MIWIPSWYRNVTAVSVMRPFIVDFSGTWTWDLVSILVCHHLKVLEFEGVAYRLSVTKDLPLKQDYHSLNESISSVALYAILLKNWIVFWNVLRKFYKILKKKTFVEGKSKTWWIKNLTSTSKFWAKESLPIVVIVIAEPFLSKFYSC